MINVFIPFKDENLHKRFKIECTMAGIAMSQQMLLLIRDWINDKENEREVLQSYDS